MRELLSCLLLVLLSGVPAVAASAPEAKKGKPPAGEKKEAGEKKKDPADLWAGLELRSLGPALTSGRIGDLAVDPRNPARYFVAVASGGVWLTENSGTTYTPVFDSEGSYSIGCVTLDPNDPFTVWVGTGENNSQRSVGYGDGVYKSTDGGKTWTNVGLRDSEHVGVILVDPRDSKVVYVAAQGPLWASGGDRGLYKTEDGGMTWKAVLAVGPDTGVSDVVMDPRSPDVLYASAYQRRRHVWTLVDGGPESAIYKSQDAGQSWQKLTKGLPKEQMGRIGLALSPADPDVLYAIVEAVGKAGGFFRSTDRGGSFEKRSDYVSQSPQYYNEIVADPKDVDRVYSMDTFLHVTEDGGKTFRKIAETTKHIDNHAIWIEPRDTRHIMVGSDGGVYESWDRGTTWDFKANLPVTQFYRVTADNASPIYNVYGGTQDNFSLAGPSRTRTVHGITNQDWILTVSGDGFETVVDPEDPDTIYAQAQHGALSRYDRRTGEAVFIQPQPGAQDEPPRWNWDSPLILSPHSRTRLYFAAQLLYRSDDRGDSWRAVSGDLTRRLDRDALPVMGKVWGPDAVAKNASTSFYGNIVSLDESPLREGLLYVGTDDGLVQVSEDGGGTWRKQESFPGVPERAYVSDLMASRHDAAVVYAAFDNHKMGDFKPYVLRSADRGRTWTTIASDLPERGTVYTLAEDHVDRDLLFAGTEFGLFFTQDGGRSWGQLKGGLPTIAVRDLEIQRREGDLVVGTFGRGIYVLDDYSPLRLVRTAEMEKASRLLPPRKGLLFAPAVPLGLRGKAMQGDSFYTAPNPPPAVFTYVLGEELKTRKKLRQEREKEAEKKGTAPAYPTLEDLRREAREEEPAVLLTIRDAEGQVVRRLPGPTEAGVHRVAWDLRFPPLVPTTREAPDPADAWDEPPLGPLVVPGRYTVTAEARRDGKLAALGEPQAFEVAGAFEVPAAQRAELLAFQLRTARLQRAALGAVESVDEVLGRVKELKKALLATPAFDPAREGTLQGLEERGRDLKGTLAGDDVRRRRHEPALPGVVERIDNIVISHWNATAAPTRTNLDAYGVAEAALREALDRLRALDGELRKVEEEVEKAGGPWTPGRIPRLTMP